MTIALPSSRGLIQAWSKPREITRNTVQVNVCILVDVAQVLATCSLDNAVLMIDNSVTFAGDPSPGRGTTALATQCTYGTVINWILYTVAPYGCPLPIELVDIHFDDRICFKLKSYGDIEWDRSPDAIQGITPVYNYWAGLVLPDVPPKLYPYTIRLKIGDLHLALSTPSIEVWTIPTPIEPPASQNDRRMAQIRGDIG